ncbi:hypothetical protein GCM10010222_11870 [Streptomyces tanashiensis]|nr:hypothetical protein GCM10010222_11870 [Streptomyces tanashiensis]
MAVSFLGGVTSLGRPGDTNSSAALWSNEKTYEAAADQVSGVAGCWERPATLEPDVAGPSGRIGKPYAPDRERPW